MRHIKYDKVLIEWLDINSCDSAWNNLDDFNKLTPAKCTTVGYLYEDNKDCVKVFATYSLNSDEENDFDVGDAMVLPKGCVVSVKKLEN